MMNIFQTFKKGDEKLEIFFDENPESPREYDNLGVMVCSHSQYSLGDEQIDCSFQEYLDKNDMTQDDIAIQLPLWLYDHSGITMSCGDRVYPYDDQWDSGCVGVIYATKKKLMEEYSVERISSKLIERVTGYLKNEVKTYDDYLRGNVYGYIHSKILNCDLEHEHTETIDSCSGFIGDPEENGIYQEFKMDEWQEITEVIA